MHRRRREGVTDYRSRRKAISSQGPLLVVRFSNKNVSAQFVQPKVGGDSVLASAHSAQLRKLGWKGSLKSTPACYLLGMIAGKTALDKGVNEAVLYNGLTPFIAGARVSAFVKGVVDSGVTVPVGEKGLPSEDRISGKFIADFATKVAAGDRAAYEKKFSGLLKAGFKPEQYPAEFERFRTVIAGAKK